MGADTCQQHGGQAVQEQAAHRVGVAAEDELGAGLSSTRRHQSVAEPVAEHEASARRVMSEAAEAIANAIGRGGQAPERSG